MRFRACASSTTTARAARKDLTREYVLDLQARAGQAPLLTVYGGKITTYRRLAEAALRAARALLQARRSRGPRDAPLPGGDFPMTASRR